MTAGETPCDEVGIEVNRRLPVSLRLGDAGASGARDLTPRRRINMPELADMTLTHQRRRGMERRAFLGALGSAVACPIVARAQSRGSPAGGAVRRDDYPNRLQSLLQKAEQIGAPATAVQRAAAISRQPIFDRKDAFAVFDISQPSANKRLYVLDLDSGQVSAHFAAHGKANGPNAQATKFKGFQRDLDMVPLGPLKIARSEVMQHYSTIADRYDGTIYKNMIVSILEGTTPYNKYINHTPPYKWVIHPSWYTTAGFRSKNNGMLGRSNGCVTLDPVENNKLIKRLERALIYVTVGDAPIEQYI